MLIWHKIFRDGKYYMRENMMLYQDMQHLKNDISVRHYDVRVTHMDCVPGNAGMYRITDKAGQIIGEAYDPDIYRMYPGTEKEAIIPAYKDFFDEDGKFSAELFKQNYRGTKHGL